MGKVHDLIEQHGKQAALALEADRRAVEAAAAYLADEENGIGFLYSGWCQAALPHRRLADDEEWQIRSDHVNMAVQPGIRTSAVGRAEKVGVPYGSRARLIMIYVQTEALRTTSREVGLGGSMNQWLHLMGIPLGGKSISSIRDQAERISRCSFTFDRKGAKGGGIARMTIFDRAIFSEIEEDGRQGTLFPQVAKLSEQFYQQLTDHPVPLEEAAIRAISNNSMALDLYAWLAYRLHALRGPTPVSFAALKAQFGAGFDRTKHFRPAFIDNLRLAMAVYRDAKVEVTERGVDLYPSRPPIAPRQIAVDKVLGSDPGRSIKSSARSEAPDRSIKSSATSDGSGRSIKSSDVGGVPGRSIKSSPISDGSDRSIKSSDVGGVPGRSIKSSAVRRAVRRSIKSSAHREAADRSIESSDMSDILMRLPQHLGE